MKVANPRNLRVMPRSRFERLEEPGKAYTLFVNRDAIVHLRNAVRLGDVRVVIRPFSQVHLAYDRNPSTTAPTVRKVIEENRVAHEAKLARGIVELDGSCKGQIAVICGAGRSLVEHREEVIQARRDGVCTVFTINSALGALPTDVVDYHFMLDWSARKEWWEKVETRKVNLVISPAVPPDVLLPDWKSIRYFSGPVTELKDSTAGEEWAHVGSIEQCLHASYSVLHLCYKMGFKRVLLVGHDYACTDLWYHWNARIPADLAVKEKMHGFEDCWGNSTYSGWRMERNMMALHGASILCEEHDNMPVVNCSLQGILCSERQADLTECLDDDLPLPLVKPEPIPDVDRKFGRKVA